MNCLESGVKHVIILTIDTLKQDRNFHLHDTATKFAITPSTTVALVGKALSILFY